MSTEIKNIDNKNKNEGQISKNKIQIQESLKAIGSAFLIGLLLIIITGQSSEILIFIKSIFTLSFGDLKSFANFLGKLAYMIPLGLSLAVSFRMKIFNIGSAGQAIGGGLAAYIFASNVNVGDFGFLITILIGVIVGSLLAQLIALLKNYFKIHEVISSIMLNWIIFYILKYFAVGAGESIILLEGNDLRMDWLSNLFGTSTSFSQINIGIIISIPLIFIFAWLYKNTLWGYKQDLIGNNKNIGDYIGINKKAEITKTMAISGALAGFAGVVYYTGYNVNLPQNSIQDIPAWGFEGITIALIGFNSPIGILFSSILIGLLTFSSDDLDILIGDLNIIDIMIGIMILFLAKSHYRINYGKKIRIKEDNKNINKDYKSSSKDYKSKKEADK